MFTSLKNRGLAAVVRPVLNGILHSRFQGTAVMLDLKIDSGNRRISCTVELAGDPEPVSVTVNQYEIVEENGGMFLRFGSIETSREWMTVLARSALPARRVPVPPRYAGLLKLAL